MRRGPMLQPPGMAMVASPRRATKGPMTMMLARMVRTSSYGAQPLSAAPACTRRTSPACSTFAPSARSIATMVATSVMRGTRRMMQGSSVSRLAASSLSAEFLAPESTTAPSKRRPPRT